MYSGDFEYRTIIMRLFYIILIIIILIYNNNNINIELVIN